MSSSSAFKSDSGRLLYIVPKRDTQKSTEQCATDPLDEDEYSERTPNLTVSEKTRERVLAILQRNKGDRTKTADALSVPTTWVDALITKYKL